MFLAQQKLRCEIGGTGEAIHRIHRIHEQMATHPKALGMIVAKYLGNLTDLLVLRQWQDRAAFDEFMSSSSEELSQSESVDLFTSLPVAQHWDEVMHTPGYVKGSFIWRSTYHIAPERWDIFLKLRRDDDKLAQWYALAEHPGTQFASLVEARTFRGCDDARDAMAIIRLQDREAMEDIVAAPSRAEIVAQLMERETHPRSARAPRDCNFSECYELVDEIVASNEVA
jgi:hypothetical protein